MFGLLEAVNVNARHLGITGFIPTVVDQPGHALRLKQLTKKILYQFITSKSSYVLCSVVSKEAHKCKTY